MPYHWKLVIKHQLNLGEQVVLLLVFPVYVVVVPIDLAREHSEICAGVDVCFPQPKPGVDGTGILTLLKSGMQFAPQLLLLEFPH